MTTPPLLSGKAEPSEEMSRRRFFARAGLATLFAAVLSGLGSFFEFLHPNVLFEPPLTLGLGRPDDYSPDSLTPRYDEKLYVLHAAEGYIALDTTCTHLGCQTRWVEEEGMIECPCHGSKFGRDGSLLQGPAPRALRRWLLSLKQGELVVEREAEAPPDFILRV